MSAEDRARHSLRQRTRQAGSSGPQGGGDHLPARRGGAAGFRCTARNSAIAARTATPAGLCASTNWTPCWGAETTSSSRSSSGVALVDLLGVDGVVAVLVTRDVQRRGAQVGAAFCALTLSKTLGGEIAITPSTGGVGCGGGDDAHGRPHRGADITTLGVPAPAGSRRPCGGRRRRSSVRVRDEGRSRRSRRPEPGSPGWPASGVGQPLAQAGVALVGEHHAARALAQVDAAISSPAWLCSRRVRPWVASSRHSTPTGGRVAVAGRAGSARRAGGGVGPLSRTQPAPAARTSGAQEDRATPRAVKLSLPSATRHAYLRYGSSM